MENLYSYGGKDKKPYSNWLKQKGNLLPHMSENSRGRASFRPGLAQGLKQCHQGDCVLAWLSSPSWVVLILRQSLPSGSPGTAAALVCMCVQVCWVASVVSDSLWPSGLHQAPLSMEFSRQEYWSGCHARPRDGTCVSSISCIGRWILYHWATAEACSSSGPHTDSTSQWTGGASFSEIPPNLIAPHWL